MSREKSEAEDGECQARKDKRRRLETDMVGNKDSTCGPACSEWDMSGKEW